MDDQYFRERMQKFCDRNSGKKESQNVLTEWAASYEQDAITHGYTGHMITAKYANKVVPMESRSSVQVLDVAAGTGLVASQLRGNGFKNIDALEPNEALVAEAQRNNRYDNYHKEFLCGTPTNVPDSTYDLLTGSGISRVFQEEPQSVISEMIRLVKPGGHIILVLLQTWVEEYKVEDVMQKVESDGMWTRVSRNVEPNYYKKRDGEGDCIVWAYQKPHEQNNIAE